MFDGLDLEKLRYAFGALSDCDDSSNLSKPSTWRNRATHRLDNEQSHSIDGDGNSGTEVKKKRGRKPNPFRTRNKSLFSRILKTDIRRDYAIMFNNAVNSHDPTLLMRYLRKFAHPDMQVVGDLPDNGNIVMSRLAQLQSLFDQQLPPPPNMDMSFLPPTGTEPSLNSLLCMLLWHHYVAH
ncbi:hypothetical protein EON64_01495 [archaeon]|nr:MAG: hypothetical protein EON64_01495 [archaeon]